MRSSAAQSRTSAFTLIELLVVVAILGLLSAIVLPNIAGNINSRRYREGSRSVSSFVSRCQSRAIGASASRGVMLQPLAASSSSCLDLYFADTPLTYSGELTTSVATVDDFAGTYSGGTLGVSFVNGATQAPDSATTNRLSIPGFAPRETPFNSAELAPNSSSFRPRRSPCGLRTIRTPATALGRARRGFRSESGVSQQEARAVHCNFRRARRWISPGVALVLELFGIL